MDNILNIIFTTLLIAAQIATVYLAARGNRWTWVLSIITGMTLCYNFFTETLYLSFAFQVYSILASIGGVRIWKKKESDNRRTICWGNPVWPLLSVVALTAAVYFIVYIALHRFGVQLLDSKQPLIDCAIPALQAVATFLMVRKDINAWICYLICDAIYIPLGIISVAHGGSYKWFFISACFLATATYGTINFIKAYRLSKQSKEQ